MPILVGVAGIILLMALLIAGTAIGQYVGHILEPAPSVLVNCGLSLLPALLIVLRGDKKGIWFPLAIGFSLVSITTATFNLHAAAFSQFTEVGSTSRALGVLTGIIWPTLAATGSILAVRATTGKPSYSLSYPRVWLAAITFVLNLAVAWVAIEMFNRNVVLTVFTISVAMVLISMGQAELRCWQLRRGATQTSERLRKVVLDVNGYAQTSLFPVELPDDGFVWAEVYTRLLRPPLLVLSGAASRLPTTTLTAIVAHESAHVSMRHLRSRAVWGGLSLVLLCVVALILQALLPAGYLSAVNRTFVAVMIALVAQRLLMYTLIRRQEREADLFAAQMAGNDAMVDALKRSAAGNPQFGLAIWVTHDSLSKRQQLIERRM